MSEFKPSERPTNLIVVGTIKNPPPIEDTTEQGVFDWCETLRDDLQREGKLLSVRGLVLAARAAVPNGVDPMPITKAIKVIYATEYVTEQNGDKSKTETKKPGKTPKVKAELPLNLKPPSKNGKLMVDGKIKADKKAVDPRDTKKPNRPTKGKATAETIKVPKGTPIKFSNKTNVPVAGVISPKGRTQIRIFNHSIRSVMRWMGKHDWTFEESLSVLNKLGIKKWEGSKRKINILPITLTNQLTSGSHGEDGWAGPIPKMSSDEEKKLKALRPAKAKAGPKTKIDKPKAEPKAEKPNTTAE